MNRGKADASGLLGALLSGDTSALARLAEQAAAQTRASRHADADDAAAEDAAMGGIEVPHAAREAVRNGQLMVAIRELRKANPALDLNSANQAARALAKEATGSVGKARSSAAMVLARANRPPTVAPGDRGGIRAVVYALALAGGALAWWMYSGG